MERYDHLQATGLQNVQSSVWREYLFLFYSGSLSLGAGLNSLFHCVLTKLYIAVTFCAKTFPEESFSLLSSRQNVISSITCQTRFRASLSLQPSSRQCEQALKPFPDSELFHMERAELTSHSVSSSRLRGTEYCVMSRRKVILAASAIWRLLIRTERTSKFWHARYQHIFS